MEMKAMNVYFCCSQEAGLQEAGLRQYTQCNTIRMSHKMSEKKTDKIELAIST